MTIIILLAYSLKLPQQCLCSSQMATSSLIDTPCPGRLTLGLPCALLVRVQIQFDLEVYMCMGICVGSRWVNEVMCVLGLYIILVYIMVYTQSALYVNRYE